MTSSALTPAEALVLLDPRGASAVEALKVTLLSMAARGDIKLGEVEQSGFFRNKKVPTVRLVGDGPSTPGHVASLCDIVKQAQKADVGARMPDVARVAVQAYGKGVANFKKLHVMPSLVRRGLLKEENDRVLFLFNRKLYTPTPTGHAEISRLNALIDRARRIPALLQTDRAAATAIVLAAGAMLLLVPELKPFYGQLGALDRSLVPNVGSDGVSVDTSTSSMDFGAAGDFHAAGDAGAHSGLDFSSFDFGAFDASAFSSLDMDFSSFDSSFDSSFSDAGGGDGGGDGGGGDGGGGGGD